MNRRNFIATIGLLPLTAPAIARAQTAKTKLAERINRAASLSALQTIMVSRNGDVMIERGFGGRTLDGSANIKSASKSVISALVGIAIDKGVFSAADQTIETVLRSEFPSQPDPRLAEITIGHLLSMRAGLERMSGANYGRWVSSPNWTRMALAADFIDEPGGGMLYSTASTHLLSVMLTKASGKSTLALSREWLGDVDGFRIGGWERDPQGYYLGGNQMAMTPRSLHAFGELYRRGGVTEQGERVLSESWISESWKVRTHSVYNGDGYGYGWFLKDIGPERVNYAWGYGGQMLYIVPAMGLTVTMTSDPTSPSARTGYRDDLHDLMRDILEITIA